MGSRRPPRSARGTRTPSTSWRPYKVVLVPPPARPAEPAAAPDGPPPDDWAPSRLGISYRPCRLAIEYTAGGARYRKCLPVRAEPAATTAEACLAGLEADYGAFLDFENKLSKTQPLKLVEMLLAFQARQRGD